jgi:hypothetical protein
MMQLQPKKAIDIQTLKISYKKLPIVVALKGGMDSDERVYQIEGGALADSFMSEYVHESRNTPVVTMESGAAKALAKIMKNETFVENTPACLINSCKTCDGEWAVYKIDFF